MPMHFVHVAYISRAGNFTVIAGTCVVHVKGLHVDEDYC